MAQAAAVNLHNNMKKGILLLSAILALGTLSSSAQKRTATMTDEEMYLDAMHHNITTEKIFGYVKQLSDPAVEGRLAGSPGMAKAVDLSLIHISNLQR